MDFAVHIKDLHEEGKGSWVLAVTPDGIVAGGQVLIAHGEPTGHDKDDHTLHWYPMVDCTMVNVAPPNQPRPVYTVQVAEAAGEGSKLVKAGTMPVPPASRADRRRAERNGG